MDAMARGTEIMMVSRKPMHIRNAGSVRMEYGLRGSPCRQCWRSKVGHPWNGVMHVSHYGGVAERSNAADCKSVG